MLTSLFRINFSAPKIERTTVLLFSSTESENLDFGDMDLQGTRSSTCEGVQVVD